GFRAADSYGMRGGRRVGKVGEVAVVAGVGAAVFMGLGCAVASADDDTGASASTSSTEAGAGAARTTDEPSTRDERSDEETSRDDAAREESVDEAEEAERTEEALSLNEIPEDAPIEGADEDPPAAEETDPPSDVEEPVETEDPAETDSTVVVPVDAAEPSPATPADPSPPVDTPPAPAASQQLWTLIGSARRESGTEAVVPTTHKAVDSVTTSEVLDVAPDTSIVYTDGPTLFDRMVVVSLRVMRVVSNVIKVDVYGLLAKVLEREKPPWFVRHGLDVRRTEYEVSDGSVWAVWEFHPPDPTGKTVIAVHGGGFVVQPLITHWGDYSAMARRTGATVIVPMYPLATTEAGSASRVVPAMAQLISGQIAAHGAENVSVYADSAGTILAMSAVRRLVLDGHPVPASMVLLSTAPDASLSNPAIREIRDPIIDVDNLDFYRDGGHWAEGFDPRDPMVSPLFIEDAVLAGFPPTTIYIGTLEIGLPDTLLLHEKWIAAGGEVSLVVGEGQIHDWALGGSVNSQASEVRQDIYRQLGLLDSEATSIRAARATTI
ncbi:MAG: alpha/beta hydrolase fold domain-containing protein, partial [Mycobacterium sp.]|nr:alpha/beta hydrolase fold domain-containing protein [Mycobacterium sp.]